jgi:histidinol-phosphatase (PHP family)
MKIKSSYHIHSTYCDGKNTIEEMVQKAIDKNFTHIGFSSHAPSPEKYNNECLMNINAYEKYKNEVFYMGTKYKNKVNIFLGLEYDCYEDIGMAQLVPIADLDYYILSIHSLGIDSQLKAIDGTADEFEELLESDSEGIYSIVKRYYSLLTAQIIKNKPDIIGHFDIIKKNNVGNKYFNDKDNWYLDIVSESMKIIKKTGCVMEINTGGVARYGKECLYPSDEILEMAKEFDIALMLNSDAHTADNLDFFYEQTIDKIKKIGIKRLHFITENGWDDYKI